MYQYIVKCKYTSKMIQMITTFDKVLSHIYWIWVDYTISISYEKFHSYDFTKNIWIMKFFIQTSNITLKKKNCWKKKFVEKLFSFER